MATDTTTALILPIDQTHIRALRNADSIVFRLHNGQATVEANREARSSRDGFAQQTTIYADHSVADYSRGDHQSSRAASYSAFEMFHSGAKYDPALATVVGRLVKGDVLTLLWRRGAGDCESTRDAGIVVDDLSVRITKASGKAEVYLIAYQAGADNSARMIRAY